MSSAGSDADSNVPLLKRSWGRELFRKIVEEILIRLRLGRRDFPHYVVEILRRDLPHDLVDVVEEILRRDLPHDFVDVGEEILRRDRPHEVVEEIQKLPHDLVKEILKRLPVRSLLQYRSVCKLWRATIDQSGFVDLHLKHASNSHLACSGLPCSVWFFSGESLSMSKMEIPFAASGSGSQYAIVGSCNGLICVAERSKKGMYLGLMYLWNSFTRKHKHVQPYESESFSIRTSVGFGFHSESNDYTIVMIDHHTEDINKKKCGVNIYSLKTDSWRSLKREVPGDVPGEFWDFNVPTVCLNGNMYWFVPKRQAKSLVFFNLTEEVFDEIVISEEIFSGGKVVALLVLNDLLALCTVRVREEETGYSACSIWVKDSTESWNVWYSFSFNGRVKGFDGFTRNGELLMIIDDDKRVLMAIDDDKRVLMAIDDDKRVSWNRNLPKVKFNLVTVIESLVSPIRLKLKTLIWLIRFIRLVLDSICLTDVHFKDFFHFRHRDLQGTVLLQLL